MPSYRGSTFLDPKGRGAATGYDNAVALPAAADAGALCLQRGVTGCRVLCCCILQGPAHLPAEFKIRPSGCRGGWPACALHKEPAPEACLPLCPPPPPASDEFAKENTKSAAAMKGQAVFSIAKVDAATGEVAGVFESVQPSDTDLGAKAPKDVKITGLWYARLS